MCAVHTGETRLLKGDGGRIGITMWRMTKTEHKNEKKAIAIAGINDIIIYFVGGVGGLRPKGVLSLR